jgi:uncharacterized protein with NRDE domain
VSTVCLLVVASRVVPGTPVLIGANRDEFLNRPAVAVTVLDPGPPRIIGGRDTQAGGTWLAVNEHGVFAGLTNQPLGGERDPTRRSRGELPLALAAHHCASGAVDAFLDRFSPSEYNGSWLLVGDRESLFFIDFTGQVGAEAVALPPGLHILENRALGAPSLKADRVRSSLGVLTGDPAGDVAALRAVLTDHYAADPSRERPQTSANCVHLEEYGTRSSCIIRYASDPATAPQIWVADGPPCVTPLKNVSDLWVTSTTM